MWKSIIVIGPKATPTQSGGLQLRLGTVVTEQPHNTLHCAERGILLVFVFTAWHLKLNGKELIQMIRRAFE